jgi:uncharacterized protein
VNARAAARLLARNRTAAFLLALGLVGAGLAFSNVPRFTGSLRGFDLPDEPFYAARLHSDSLFGGGATVYVTITPAAPGAAEVFAAVAEMEERIAAAYPDARVVSLLPYYQAFFGAARSPAAVTDVLAAAATTPLLRNLVARDHGSMLLLVRFPASATVEPAAFERAVAGAHPAIAPPDILSMAHIEESIRTHVVRDFATLTIAVIIVFILFFAYAYRRAAAVGFAAANILVSVAAAFFFLSLFRVDLNLVTILVVPVVVVLSLADAVHLLTGYATSASTDRAERLEHVLSLYLVPSFYSSLTTAVAFFTFHLYSDSAFIRDFGLVTACALLAEFAATFLLSPFLLHTLNVRELHGSALGATSDFLRTHRVAFSAFFLAILGASVFFVPRLEFRTSTDVFFPRGSDIADAHERFNEQYYSQLDLEILVEPIAAGEASAAGVEQYVRELAAALAAEHGVRTVTTGLDRMTIPSIIPLSVPVTSMLGGDNPYFHAGSGVHRIIVTFPDADVIADFHARTFTRLQQQAPPGIEVAATSTLLIMDAVNRHVAGSLMKSLATAGLAIVLMILLMTRSILLAVLCLVPNLVPLGIVTLVFVTFGFDINILTAMTAVVCLGLLDDDTIHILYRRVALQSPLHEVSFSIVSTSAILVIGFAAFYLSSFRPVQTFGAISALVFLFGVASDLTLMTVVIDRWARVAPEKRRRVWQAG